MLIPPAALLFVAQLNAAALPPPQTPPPPTTTESCIKPRRSFEGIARVAARAAAQVARAAIQNR